MSALGIEGTSIWRGGSSGAVLLRRGFEQLAEPMVQGGYLIEPELHTDLTRLDAPDLAVPSPNLWSVRGGGHEQ